MRGRTLQGRVAALESSVSAARLYTGAVVMSGPDADALDNPSTPPEQIDAILSRYGLDLDVSVARLLMLLVEIADDGAAGPVQLTDVTRLQVAQKWPAGRCTVKFLDLRDSGDSGDWRL